MAAPTFVQATAGLTDAGGAWSIHGGVLNAAGVGNIAIAQIFQDGATAGAVAMTSGQNIETLAGTDNTWTFIGTFPVGSPTAALLHLWIGRTLNTSTAIQIDGTNSTSEDIYGRIYEFSNCSTGTTLATVIENATAGATVNGVGTSNTAADAGVTTLGADRLALNFVAVNDDNAIATFTGETGGDWVHATGSPYAESSGTDGAIALQIATIASAGTINGGTGSIVDSDAWGVVGFALIPPVSGTPHTATPADTLALADALAKARGLGRTEALAIADLFARAVTIARTVPDTVALTDATTRAKTIPKTISDSVALTDQATPAEIVAYTVPVDDTLALADALMQDRGLAQADALTLADSGALLWQQEYGSDAVAVTDSAVTASAIARALQDTLALADSLNSVLSRAIDDTVALADSLSRVVESARALADSVALADALAQDRANVLADAVSLADEATPDLTVGTVDHEVPVDDTLSLADLASTESAFARALADSAALQDAIAQDRGRVEADAVISTDEFARIVEAARFPADTLALLDELSRVAAYERLPTDSILLTDNAVPFLMQPGTSIVRRRIAMKV